MSGLRLARDIADGTRFVSFGRWDSIEEVHAWKGSPEFRERMGAVRRHVAEFAPNELEVVATVRKGRSPAKQDRRPRNVRPGSRPGVG